MIIATRNRRHLLAQTLPTVLGQDYPPQAFEVVLVDDGSVDGTADWARSLNRSCSLEVVRQPGRGPAAARNRGIAVASGELLLFLDDDIACELQLLKRARSWASSGPRWTPARAHRPSPREPGDASGAVDARVV